MTSIMPRAMPCIRCKTTLVKTGGVTHMCSACRIADPAMADTQRGNARLLRKAMNDWVRDNTTPTSNPRLRRVKPDAIRKGR